MGAGVLNPTLILRFADVGVATYASLRVVGEPARTLTWMVNKVDLDAALGELHRALPEPTAEEPVTDALVRAFTEGAFATAATEVALARRLGAAILSGLAWALLRDASGAALFISPSARLGRVPWVLLAAPDDHAVERRLVELVDVLMAVPPNIVNAVRPRTAWEERRHRLPLLVLDPRVPGQRPDSALGSVLGRPSAHTRLAEHFAGAVAGQRVLPKVAAATDLFRRTDADRDWFAAMLSEAPRRLLYVGHASVAEDRSGRADQAALHLAEQEPLTAATMMGRRMPMPPRVALVACASGGDYRFDEATGLVAAMILCGAQLVTATLWSLPTTAGYRHSVGGSADPMADLVIAVDDAHEQRHGGSAINGWQRECLQRWRSGDATASPLYWAALVTFAVDGAR